DHAAADAAAPQAQVGRALGHGDELGAAAVRRDGRVDLPLEHLDQLLGDVAGEIGRLRYADRGAGRGAVVDDEAAGGEVSLAVERRPAHELDALGRDD